MSDCIAMSDWIPADNLSGQVRHFLLQELTAGRLKHGDRINEADLARRLGISRNPIREAISALAQSGLLVAMPRRGAFLRSFTIEDVDDIFSFRVCLECFAARQAVEQLTPADCDAFDGLIAQMEEAAERDDRVAVQQLDLRFHRRLCELSGNRQTLRAYDMLRTELQMLIAAVDMASGSLQDSVLSHVPIAKAVRAGKEDVLVAAIETHIAWPWQLARQHYAAIPENPLQEHCDA